MDYKTNLQELLQSQGDIIIDYQVISEEGPAHDKVFEVAVLSNENLESRKRQIKKIS